MIIKTDCIIYLMSEITSAINFCHPFFSPLGKLAERAIYFNLLCYRDGENFSIFYLSEHTSLHQHVFVKLLQHLGLSALSD